ncbi:DHA2 family efflux MFS transporter permease subunit [Amycolatopsis sp. NPDC059021]|uniref:DHA2 family efflux MFS transporter permease subunit n=1 Tax=Amycolatopsis sp. NPDC059021 TaxID=3346704 RepID=UPI0036734806
MTELSRARRFLVLGICSLSLFIVGLDTTIVMLALPDIQHDLGSSVTGLQWTIDAYTITLASLLMLAGSTGDRLGRRRTFQTGLALFTLGSLLCSVAPGTGWLIVFRIAQAVGGSMMNPVAMSIITNTFTIPRERAQAIGLWGGVIGLSMALGPVLGGALVAAAGWRAVFLVNVPIGVAAIVLTALFVPESKAARPRRLDPVGQVLVIALLGSLTFGIIEGPHLGWVSPWIVGCFVVAALALLGILGYERRRAEPLLELRFFRSVPFSGATVIAICGFMGLAGFLFLNSLYLQQVRGFSPLHAGLLTLPMAVLAGVLAPVSGRIVGTRGPRLPLIVAGVGLTASAVLLTTVVPGTPVPVLVLAYAIFGIGFGMLNAPITNTAVSGMPREQAGVAAAVATTSRQVGTSLGVAVLGGAGAAGWWVMAGCGAVVLGLGILTTGRWARRTASAATAASLDPEPRSAVTTR